MPGPTLPWPQQQRQNYIRKRLEEVGAINRADIQGEFSVSSMTASVDLKLFRERNAALIVYNPALKRYERPAKASANG